MCVKPAVRTFSYQGWPNYDLAKFSAFLQQSQISNPWCNTISRGQQPAIGWKLLMLEAFPHRRTVICLGWDQHIFWIWFFFPCTQCLEQTSTQGIRTCYPFRRNLHNITQDEGTHITAKEVKQWACDHGILWSPHIAQYLEAASLAE